jgi:hypothetical protein
MEITIDRDFALAVIGAGGPEAFLRCLGDTARRKGWGRLNLFSFSREWEYAPAVRTCKAKGELGDLLVRFPA